MYYYSLEIVTEMCIRDSSSSSSNSNSSKAEKLFAVCKSLVGTKYKMGGNSPGKYMDCSHYVAYCFQKCGVSNKVKSYGTAANLYALSTKVNKSQLQEGDIIFFKNKGSNHIGIYAGNNKMWNCYSGHGVGPVSYTHLLRYLQYISPPQN